MKNYEQWIHTRVIRGEHNYTTGNWESDLDFSLLPEISLLPITPPNKKNSLTKAEEEKLAEQDASQLLNIIKHLNAWKDIYIYNLFGYSDPGLFSPELKGYIHFTEQRSAIYTILGKLFLYAMLVASFLALINKNYFRTFSPDENPKSLNNRISDRFYSQQKESRKNVKSNSSNFCFIVGLLLIIVGNVVYLIKTWDNLKHFSAVSRDLMVNVNWYVTSYEKLDAELVKINSQNYAVPHGVHRGEVMTIKNLIPG